MKSTVSQKYISKTRIRFFNLTWINFTYRLIHFLFSFQLQILDAKCLIRENFKSEHILNWFFIKSFCTADFYQAFFPRCDLIFTILFVVGCPHVAISKSSVIVVFANVLGRALCNQILKKKYWLRKRIC